MTITAIAPLSLLARQGPAPVKKEVKAKENGRTRYAGKISVRILEYRKEVPDGLSKKFKRFSSRLLIVDDAGNRQYLFPSDISPMREDELNRFLTTVVFPGILPSPGVWRPKTEEHLFMLQNGFELYHEYPNVSIGHTTKESV